MGKWIQSYRDLPLLLNLWNNVVRWELRPRLFLLTTEFLWQEGHTAHATAQDSAAYAEQILRDVYADFMVNVLAIPVLPGRKTAAERFPGAINTLTVEGMMGDGKALQMGTSHDLGQNFAKVFDITYLDDGGEQQLAWTTSWGVSTRMVGGLIMAHGDDSGRGVPPALAPTQVVVLLVRAEDGDGAAVHAPLTLPSTRQRGRHHVSRRRGSAAARVDHVVGWVDAHGRWACHGPGGRLRAGGPTGPGAHPGGRAAGARRGRCRRRGRRPRGRAQGGRCEGAGRLTGGYQLRAPGHRLGAEGRAGAHRGRPPRPQGGPGHHRQARHGGEAHLARRRGQAPRHEPPGPDPGRHAGRRHRQA